jgi:hypothetical protein
VLAGKKKGIRVNGRCKIIGSFSTVLGMYKRKLRQGKDTPLGVNPKCISASAFSGSSSKRSYTLRLISSRAEKELGLSAESILAVSEW